MTNHSIPPDQNQSNTDAGGQGATGREEDGVLAGYRVEIVPIKITKGGLLGNIDKIILQRSKDAKIWAAAREVFPRERVAWCGHRIGNSSKPVQVVKSGERAYFTNRWQCGQIWLCPYCEYRVASQRRKEEHEGIERYQAAGGSDLMITFTLSHNRGDPLVKSLNNLLKATSKLWEGRKWFERMKPVFGIEGSIGSLEIRYGFENGWHPHKHYGLLFNKWMNEFDRIALESELYNEYEKELNKLGAHASRENGVFLSNPIVDVEGMPKRNISDYIEKWGIADELLMGGQKEGKSVSINQLFLMYAQDKSEFLKQLLLEYWQAIKGKRRAVLHHGTGKLLGIVEKPADQVEEGEGLQGEGEKMEKLDLNTEQWEAVRKNDKIEFITEMAMRTELSTVKEYIDWLVKKVV